MPGFDPYTERRRKHHDHADSTPYGFTVNVLKARKPTAEGETVVFEHREPVPAWWFSCPGCGDPVGAAASCDVWTPEGAAFRREHPELFVAVSS